MNEEGNLDPHLRRHLELVKSIYERMQRENSWPWVVDPEGYEKLMDKQPEEET